MIQIGLDVQPLGNACARDGQRRTRKTTPRSEGTSALKKRLDRADIVRDVRKRDQTSTDTRETLSGCSRESLVQGVTQDCLGISGSVAHMPVLHP